MIGLLIIGIPLVIFIWGALSVARRDLSHPDDYFLAYKRVGTTAFSSSSIAYAFQVSTIYPFLLWGASNFYFVPAVNTIGWGVGILLFYLCFDRYKKFIGEDVTLHGFLGLRYGVSVRVVASYLTMIGFLGFAIAETYFGSKVLLSLVDSRTVFYFLVGGAMLLVYGYIAYGGQVSSLRTDQLQLIIAYTGVFGMVLYFTYLLISQHIPLSGLLSVSFLVLVLYIPIVLLFRKFSFIKFHEGDTAGNNLINRLSNAVVGTLLVALVVVLLVKLCQSGVSLDISHFFNLEGFGLSGLASLVLLPLCWQFVDLTNWQRLLSVKADREGDTAGLHENIRKGLLVYAVESPFTWILFLFFGLLTVTALPHFTFNDLLIDIPKNLIHAQSATQRFVGFVFIVSVLAIMLSTVDSFLTGIIFTYVYDTNGRTRRLLDHATPDEVKANYKKITNTGRWFGLCAVIIGLLLFILFDKNVPNGGEMFVNLLLAFYSAQLSFFPLIFGILFIRKKTISTAWANATMLTGAIAGIGLGIYSVIWNPNLAWYPILICLGLSGIVYVIGLVSSNRSIESA